MTLLELKMFWKRMNKLLGYEKRWTEIVPVCVTVWCTHTPGATAGEEADRTSDKPNTQVRGNLLFH